MRCIGECLHGTFIEERVGASLAEQSRLGSCFSLAGYPGRAAEYNGQSIDGRRFEAEVYSYSRGSYYTLEVEFIRDQVIIYFPRGGRIVVDLDDEVIEDLSDVSAWTLKHGFWDIDLDY